jgi:hypothetical protein
MADLLDRNQEDDFRDRDVTDAWMYINPGKTPWLTMAPKGRQPKVRKLEQPMMLRPTPRNAPVPDGKDTTADEYENVEDNKKMAVGTWQQARRATKVGKIANVLGAQVPSMPAKGSLLRQNVEEFMITLRRDVEKVCLDNEDLFFETDDDHPNRTRGAGQSILATAQAQSPYPVDFLTPADSIKGGKATKTSITEDDLGDILESIYEANEDPADLDMFCRLGVKRQMADWTRQAPVSADYVPLRRFTADQADDKIKHSVSVYEGEGIVRVHPHFHLPAGAGAAYIWAYLFQMEFWKVHMVDAPKFEKHEDKGGGPRGHMAWTFFNMCMNPRKHGKITK